METPVFGRASNCQIIAKILRKIQFKAKSQVQIIEIGSNVAQKTFYILILVK